MAADSYKNITGFYVPTKINTILNGLTIAQNCSIDLYVRNLNKTEGEFGFIYNDNNKLLFGFRNNNNNNTALRAWIGNTEKNLVNDINNNKFNLVCDDISKGIYRVNGTVVATIPYTGTSFTGSISGFQNCSNIVFYQINIRSSNVLYQFRPVIRNGDGKVGFYEVFSDKFYPVENAVPIDSTIFDSVISLEIPEGEVSKIEDKDGNVLWSKQS